MTVARLKVARLDPELVECGSCGFYAEHPGELDQHAVVHEEWYSEATDSSGALEEVRLIIARLDTLSAERATERDWLARQRFERLWGTHHQL